MKTENFNFDQSYLNLTSLPEKNRCSVNTFLQVLLIAAGILATFSVHAAKIELTVDRIPVNMNESFQLVFSSDEEPDDDPDFTPLKKDFDLLDQGKSSNISMINGEINRSITWTLTLMPKQAGSLRIPPISFGKDWSPESSIDVNKSSGSQPGDFKDESLFLRVEATPQNPYVQSQVIYTLRLYRKVNISQASLTEPEIKDAVVENFGEDKNYNTMINDESYVVTERKYAIFPQKSGAMTINPLTLTAQVITNGRSRFNGFFGSQSTKTQRITSKPVTLNVRPAPDTFKGRHWLPAKEVYLEQTWSGDVDQAKVGEPLTRTLKLLVKGVTVSQLPELFSESQVVHSNSNGELKSYPDQPVLKEQKKENNVIAMREEKVAFIPSKAGAYQLPAIEIPWWNTRTQKMETAVIPAQTITAIGSAAPAPQPSAGELEHKSETVTSPTIVQDSQNQVWQWTSAFLAFGWLTTLIYFLSKQRTQKEVDHEPEYKVDRNISALKKACRRNDAVAAKNALIKWGRMQFGASSLSRIAGECEEDLKKQILQLNQYLYDSGTEKWEGGYLLLQAFNRVKKPKKSVAAQDSVLQPLYK